MKNLLFILLTLSFITPASAANITIEDYFHNPLVLDAKNITQYRKLGCIFDNKFFTEGAVLKFADGNSRCLFKKDRYSWEK